MYIRLVNPALLLHQDLLCMQPFVSITTKWMSSYHSREHPLPQNLLLRINSHAWLFIVHAVLFLSSLCRTFWSVLRCSLPLWRIPMLSHPRWIELLRVLSCQTDVCRCSAKIKYLVVCLCPLYVKLMYVGVLPRWIASTSLSFHLHLWRSSALPSLSCLGLHLC